MTNLSLFLQNQDLTKALKEFGRDNLHELSADFFLVCVHNVTLPKLVKDTTNADLQQMSSTKMIWLHYWADMVYPQSV
jgi:hypothetical protein